MSKSSNSDSGEIKCFSCGRTDKDAALFRIRFKGEDKWICAKCLPILIHG